MAESRNQTFFSGRAEAAVRAVPGGAQLPLDRGRGLRVEDQAGLGPAQEVRGHLHATQRPHSPGLEDQRG